MRIALRHGFRVANLHLLQQLNRRLHRRFMAAAFVLAPGFGNLLADGHHRIERIFRVLQDKTDALAANFAQHFLAGTA